MVSIPYIVAMNRSSPIIENYTPTALFNLLVESRNCLSTDPRDKIFALLPLFAQRGAHFPVANYESTVVDTYTSISTILLREHGPDALSTVINSQLEGLPSWATDWSIPPSSNRLSLKDILKFPHFKPSSYNSHFHPSTALQFGAGGSSELWNPTIEFLQNSMGRPLPTIMLKAIEADEIKAVTEGCDVNARGWEGLVFRQWPRVLNLADKRLAPDFEHIADCYKTIIMMSDTEVDGWSPYMSRLISWFANPRSFEISGEENMAIFIFRRRAEPACHGRSLFITRNGRMGLGPPNSKPGDVICILKGASTPFVLRRSGHTFSLVGECYVDGIMREEILPRDDSENNSGLCWEQLRLT
jgi:hypothetical protein